MSGDAAGLIENKASGLDPWPVLLAEISMFLVFATTSKAKMMKLLQCSKKLFYCSSFARRLQQQYNHRDFGNGA
ncbi:hypothetical protein CUMW_261390 [Citrus unshiu]|uniref:Uncharacterized protein n=1 Tax=Citrus unshiu TaxID=55188 RepID=A0A2H5QTY8_CITUN|nr:hypothetical protein CUMW_261390 [Citrus unshiu]